MKFKIIGDLTSWMIPNKKLRASYKNFFKLIDIRKNVPKIKNNYTKILSELKGARKKVRVLFLVNKIC